jgi:hypothetical protein
MAEDVNFNMELLKANTNPNIDYYFVADRDARSAKNLAKKQIKPTYNTTGFLQIEFIDQATANSV